MFKISFKVARANSTARANSAAPMGTFVSDAGEPPPSVLWYQDSTLIDKTFIANEKGAVQNTFTIQR